MYRLMQQGAGKNRVKQNIMRMNTRRPTILDWFHARPYIPHQYPHRWSAAPFIDAGYKCTLLSIGPSRFYFNIITTN